MYLFFDTETTDLPKYDLPVHHIDQPHAIQLAAILADHYGSEMASISLIVRPNVNHYYMSEKAEETHGITKKMIYSYGVSQLEAINVFMGMLNKSKLLVAHNYPFDEWLLNVMLRRNGCNPLQARTFCTMKAAAPIVNIPPTEKMKKAGYTGPKNPTLTECIKHFFDEDLEGAHDALVDVRACMRVFFKLKEMEKENL